MKCWTVYVGINGKTYPYDILIDGNQADLISGHNWNKSKSEAKRIVKEQNPDLPSRFAVQAIGGPRAAGHENERVDPAKQYHKKKSTSSSSSKSKSTGSKSKK